MNSIIESFLLYFEDRTVIITAQLILNVGYAIYFLKTAKNVKKPPFVKTAIALLLFLTMCSFFSSDLVKTFNFLLKFCIPYFFYIVGFNVLSDQRLLYYFIGKNWIFLAYTTLYVILVNVLNIGESLYNKGLNIGFYTLNGLYIPTFVILLFVFLFKYIPTKKERILGLIFAVSTTLILIILLKRTLILFIVLGLVIYFLKTISVKSIFKAALLFITFLIIGSFFKDSISQSIEARSSRFSDEYDPSEEGRFTEIFYVYDYMSKQPTSLIWGTGEVFNDRETVSRIYGGDREAHNSYIRLLWSSGFIGLVLFLFIYYQQFILARKYYSISKSRSDIGLADLFFFIVAFIIMRFMNDFSGGITYIGYNAFSLVIIGGAYSLFKNMENTNSDASMLK